MPDKLDHDELIELTHEELDDYAAAHDVDAGSGNKASKIARLRDAGAVAGEQPGVRGAEALPDDPEEAAQFAADNPELFRPELFRCADGSLFILDPVVDPDAKVPAGATSLGHRDQV